MLDILVRVVIIAIALIAAVYLVPRVDFDGSLIELGVIAAIFGLINAYLRPIVRTFSLPLNLFAFGIVGLVINTLLVLLLAFIGGQLNLGFTLAGWPPGNVDLDVIVAAVLTAIVVSIVSTVLAMLKFVTPRM
jgi:putative membrane protein